MITLVYAYYNNAQMLQRHLTEWSKYPDSIKQSLRAIIVDDCSHVPAEITIDPGFKVQLYRVLEDIPWNWSGARNLAMSRFEGWALMTDMDHLLTVDNAKRMFRIKTKKGTAYRPQRLNNGQPYKRHINSYLIHTKDFWKAGGHDEDFAGHYGSGQVYLRNLSAVCDVIKTDAFALELYNTNKISDAKTKNLGRFKSKYCAKKVPELLANL
jgi:hypothetical protein